MAEVLDFIDIIESAIARRQCLKFDYPPGMRLIEPHVLGRSSRGDYLLRAYQVSGASASGEHEHWKLFRLDRANGIDGTVEAFPGPRPQYNPDDSAMKGGIIGRL
jgi:hypothetical protein